MQQSRQMEQILAQLSRDPGLVERLPSQEGEIVREAMSGKSVYEIASDCKTSESNVWHVLGRVAREASGAEMHPVETGGFGALGSDSEISQSIDPNSGGTMQSSPDQGQRQRSAQIPQTPHPSQAEGDERPIEPPTQTPPTRHPSQAEGNEEDVEESLRRQERNRQ